jgi:hypothetical protein
MLLAAVFMVSTSALAAMPTDPIGGKPPAGSKISVKDLDYQVKYQRAFEAVVWSMPAVAVYGWFKGAKPTGVKRPFPVLRVYGGTAKFWDKSWKMPDVKLVE